MAGARTAGGVGSLWRYAAAVLLTGVAAGASGAALTLLLHGVQHLAFGYTENTFLTGVERASAPRRVVAVGAGGLAVGLGWAWHRRYLRRRRPGVNISVTHAVADPGHGLPVVATTIDAVLQIVGVGVGGSLGREGAPRQVAAALGGAVATRLQLDPEHRRLLLAAGAGAGLAAVYNVPFGGAAFTVEILLGTLAPSNVVVALTTAWVADVVAWPFLGRAPTYQLPPIPLTGAGVVAATLVAPLLGAAVGPLGLAFRSTMTYARTHAPRGWPAVVGVTAVFTALGAAGIPYPELLGNGKSLAQLDFAGSLTLGVAAALAVLKPLATAACLRGGAIGGLLTPSFATGATVGVVVGHVTAGRWAALPTGSLPLLGAAALLAVTQRAPVTAGILAVEFTAAPLWLLPALLLAAVAATATARLGAGLVAGQARTTVSERRPGWQRRLGALPGWAAARSRRGR